MGITPVSIVGTGFSAPPTIIYNKYWEERHPALVAKAEEKTWMWRNGNAPSIDGDADSTLFFECMKPYLSDPFRGAEQRRWLAEGETIFEHEINAAKAALEEANLSASDLDLILSTTFISPERIGVGGASFLAEAFSLSCAAWNIESACSSPLIGLINALALIRSGMYRRVLVVISCSYSKIVDEESTLAWGVGDAATAFVVSVGDEGHQLKGNHVINTCATNRKIWTDLDVANIDSSVFRLRVSKDAASVLQKVSGEYLKACVQPTLQQAGLGTGDIDYMLVSTPLAWYAEFCAKAIGVDPAKTLSTYPKYANIGPALLGGNLDEAKKTGKIEVGMNVLLYTVGSVSSAAAVLVRW